MFLFHLSFTVSYSFVVVVLIFSCFLQGEIPYNAKRNYAIFSYFAHVSSIRDTEFFRILILILNYRYRMDKKTRVVESRAK